MSIEENLTYLQKAAIKGEIAFALSTAAHNAEMKYRVYLILKEVDEKYKGLILSCVKESITGHQYFTHFVNSFFCLVQRNYTTVPFPITMG